MVKTITNFCTTFPADLILPNDEFQTIIHLDRVKPGKVTPAEKILLERGYILRRQLKEQEILGLERGVASVVGNRIQGAVVKLDFLKPGGINVAIFVEDERADYVERILKDLQRESPGLEVAPRQLMYRRGLERY